MKDRTKILHNIVDNILEILPTNNDELNIAIEDWETKKILDFEIKLSVRKLEKGE